MKELVGRISQEIRIRPTCREIESLQAQIREGRYQPDPRKLQPACCSRRGGLRWNTAITWRCFLSCVSSLTRSAMWSSKD